MELKGKIVVVSGATSGIGQACALKLAAQGAEVLAVGRDAERGRALEAALKAASGGSGSFIQADLSLLAEARRVVADVAARTPKLDALVLSAGALDFENVQTSEGLNRTFVVNFLHKVVLAEGLEPLLAKAGGRLVLVAADIPDTMLPDWANFEGARQYAGIPTLPRMHAACLSALQAWSAAWKADGVEAMAIHPGIVSTGFFRSAKGPWKLLKLIFGLFETSPELPAGLVAWLAFSPEAKGFSGEFFPAVKDFKKHKTLKRPAADVERVMRVAHSLV